MTCNFTSFITVFHSYQDDGRVTMKSHMPQNLFIVKKKLHLLSDLDCPIIRLVLNPLSYQGCVSIPDQSLHNLLVGRDYSV